jgi:hypothetical protein
MKKWNVWIGVDADLEIEAETEEQAERLAHEQFDVTAYDAVVKEVYEVEGD